LSQLLSKVSVTSCSFYITLLLDDALKPATLLITPLVSGVGGLSASSSSNFVDFLKYVVTSRLVFSYCF